MTVMDSTKLTPVLRALPGQRVEQNTGIRGKRFVDRLLNEGWAASDSTKLLEGLAERLVERGIPLSRMLVFVQSLHPQMVGVRYTWHRETGQVEAWSVPYSAQQTATYRDSPTAAIIEGTAGVIRRRLDITPPSLDYPILKDLLEAGATDYVAMPLVFSDETIHVITFLADRPGGFTDAELDDIKELVMVLARLLEVHAVRRTARDLLDTYLGKHTGERVLRGLIRRGDGEDIHAVIWFCDLRDSTAMADSMPRSTFLGILNDFFDCVAGAVLDHGGEVLRYIGDAVLAIFPTGTSSCSVRRECCDTVTACHSALEAAKDTQTRMKVLNQKRAQSGKPPLRYGLALHMGDVTYGNIGVPERLEFTVIGAAANEAARMEALCKTLNQPLLVSSAFKRCFPGEMISLGFHTLRGVGAATEIFTLPEVEP
jgi:adenylate cyclase